MKKKYYFGGYSLFFFKSFLNINVWRVSRSPVVQQLLQKNSLVNKTQNWLPNQSNRDGRLPAEEDPPEHQPLA